MSRYRQRRQQPRITDPQTHPHRSVCLAVAAEFLEMDERTVRARIDSGDLPAMRDKKVYRILVTDLLAYNDKRDVLRAAPKPTTSSGSVTS